MSRKDEIKVARCIFLMLLTFPLMLILGSIDVYLMPLSMLYVLGIWPIAYRSEVMEIIMDFLKLVWGRENK